MTAHTGRRKLTEAQIRFLQDRKETDSDHTDHQIGRYTMRGFKRASIANPTATRLRVLGLIDFRAYDPSRTPGCRIGGFFITEAGRTALAENKK